jgi:branched-chain amino acid transport system substrate-binding protein
MAVAAALLLALATVGEARAQAAPLAPVPLAMIEVLSGPFANTGDAVRRNLQWAVERVNARGGVRLPEGQRPLVLRTFDSKGQADEAVNLLRLVTDQGIGVILQGNSSAVAGALIEAVNKHNEREPQRRAVFLNYSAIDPPLTNERCSPWHFRFDAHADMRLQVLTDVLRDDQQVRRVFLIGQDYSFGQHVLRKGRELIAAKRPDIEVVGQELHPMGRVRDFLPYATKIKSSGAQAVLTGNWGNDLTLLVKALRDVQANVRIYTFYGNALGAPAAIGEAGVERVVAINEWHPNEPGSASGQFYAAYRQRFALPQEDYPMARLHVMVEMLVQAMERAGSTQAEAVARALSGLSFDGKTLGGLYSATMRAEDHQLMQPLVVSVMARAPGPGVMHDVEGSGFGFRTTRRVDSAAAALPHRCVMKTWR